MGEQIPRIRRVMKSFLWNKSRVGKPWLLVQGYYLPSQDGTGQRWKTEIQLGEFNTKYEAQAELGGSSVIKEQVYVKFDAKGGKIAIPSEADEHVEAAAVELGLWDGKSEDFPSFTLYRGDDEIGGG